MPDAWNAAVYRERAAAWRSKATSLPEDSRERDVCQDIAQGYDDLARSAVTFEVFGVEVRAASLKDILRSKLSSNRPQDQHQQDVIVLKEMLKRLQA